MKRLLLLMIFGIGIGMVGWGQTTVFTDDFSTNTSTSYIQSGVLNTSAWTVTTGGTANHDFGARRNTSPAQLELTNDAGFQATNQFGWAFPTVTLSSFGPPFISTLGSNTGIVTWTFNFRTNRTSALAGFSSTSSYGMAMVLASTTKAATTGSGYAVVMGGGTSNNIALIYFNNGLQGTRTTIIGYGGTPAATTNYMSVKVTYNPTGHNWSLFSRDDGSTAFADPTTGTLTQIGSTTSNNTYIGIPMYYFGAYWQGSTGASQTAFFDNTNVTVTIPSSSASDIIGAANETSNIDYASKQASSITAIGDAVRLFSFTIRDGGGSADGDALPTILASITLNKGASNVVTSWANTLRQAALYDGITEVAEISVTGETIAFTGLSGANVTAADDGSKTLDLYVTFESAVTDNQQFQFQITNANVAAAASGSSTFTTFTAVLSSVTDDANRIEVSATNIIFDQNVSTVALGAVMSPSPTLRAIDANLNYDLDYGAAWSVAVSAGSTTFHPDATSSGSFSSGMATLDDLIFNATGTANELTVTSGSFTDVSNPFDVTNPLPEINLKQNTSNIASGGSYDFSNQLSGTSSSAITFTIENLGTATLNLTGTPIIAKSGTNASEFTVDQTATSSTVNASSNTTFTITFSPTSQGSKTAQISIDNNDASGSENPYVINLTGNGTVSSASDITNTGGYSYTSDIAYASYQTATILTTGNSAGVNGLTIRDGAGAADDDNLGTTLTAISFTTGGSTAIRTAALFNGSSNVSEVAVNGATTITFSGLTLSAADGGTKDFELRVTFMGTVTDNQQITFTVSSATASTAGSGFAAGNAGGAASTATGDINRIEVVATKIVFTTSPSITACPNTNLSTPPVVTAQDANNNTDLDFTDQVTLTNSGLIGMSNYQMNAASGVANFSTLQFTETGNVTLSTTNTSFLDNDGPTASIAISVSNVTATGATNGNTQSVVSWTNPSCYDDIMIIARAGGAVTGSPTGDGSSYSASLTFGSGTGFDGGYVVYKGPTSSQTVTNLTNGTTYHFTFFTRKGSSWSVGVTTTATPVAVSSSSDYFRSKASGNWNVAGSWESSADGNTWINSTLAPTTSANAVTIQNGHEVTVSASVSVDQVVVNSGGQITVSSGQTLTIANGTGTDMTVNGTLKSSGTLTTTGTLSFGDGGKYQDSHTSNEPIPIATWHSNSTIEIIGYITNTNIPSNTGQTFGNFVWNCTSQSSNFTMASFAGGFAVSGSFKVLSTGSGTLRFTGNSGKTITVNSLIIEGGTFDLSSGSGVGTFIITGDFIMNGGTLTESGSASGAVQLGGSSAQYINYTAGTISNNVNFTVNGTDVIVTGDAITLPSNLIINASKKLTINVGKALTVSGTLTLNGSECLVLKSDATGTASLIDNGTISGSGTAKIERYLTKYNLQATPEDWKFHFLSSPVGTAQAIMPGFQKMDNDTSDFFMWDEPSGYWINTKTGSSSPYTWNTAFGADPGAFVTGKGYLVAYPSNGTKNFTGKPYTGSVVMTCTNNNTTSGGWNLLGNPFPSAIDWDAVALGTGMDNALYYYDNGPPRYRYYIPLTGGIGNSYSGGARFIPAMQGFMVHAKTTGTPTVTMENADRVHESMTIYYKDAPLTSNVLNIRVEGNDSRDDARVCFYDLATENFDGEFDAYKLFSYNTTIPELYSVTPDNTQVAINTLPLSQMSCTVPLGFKPGTAGTFTFTADGVESFSPTTAIYLQDLKNGYEQNLNDNPIYNFSSTPGDNAIRFQLRFGTVGINDPAITQPISAWYTNGSLFVTAAEGTTHVSIYNIQGQNLQNNQLHGSGLQSIALNLPAGVYFAHLVNNGSMRTVKMIVK